jgi:hypothetical protein
VCEQASMYRDRYSWVWIQYAVSCDRNMINNHPFLVNNPFGNWVANAKATLPLTIMPQVSHKTYRGSFGLKSCWTSSQNCQIAQPNANLHNESFSTRKPRGRRARHLDEPWKENVSSFSTNCPISPSHTERSAARTRQWRTGCALSQKGYLPKKGDY